MTARRNSGGFAIMIVVMLVGIAAILGLTYIASASVKLTASRNMAGATQARYAAESGLEHAKWLLEDDPTVFAGGAVAGPYAVESGGYTYRVWGTSNPLTPGLYTVYSEGTAGAFKRRCSAKIECQTTPFMSLAHAIFIDANTTIPTSVTITGSVHVDGSLTNRSRINGDVTYTGSISGSLSAITGTYYEVSHQPNPDISWSDYQDYTISGNDYSCANTWDMFYTAAAPYNNGNVITGSNIGGVLRLRAGITYFAGNVHFRGTLITDNPIIFDGGNITLEAQPGFPALVTTGYIYLTNNARVTINGVVVTKWPISPLLGTSSSRLIINGAVFGDNDGFASTLSGSHTVTYDAARARLYDLGTTVTGTAGVTDWLE